MFDIRACRHNDSALIDGDDLLHPTAYDRDAVP
jgi:hypothetical protein